MFFLDSSRHSRFPAKHTSAHTHTHACTHAPVHTRTPLYLDGFSNAIDLIDSKGLLFHDQRFPLVCDQHILHTVLRRRENHKTFILTMALNKDYRHPRKFCIFRAKFVSLGPSIRLTLSPSIYPKRSQSFYIEDSGLVSFSNEASRKISLSKRGKERLIPRNQESREFAIFIQGICGNFHKFHRILRIRHSLAKYYHPMIVFLKYRKASRGNALVNISARWY